MGYDVNVTTFKKWCELQEQKSCQEVEEITSSVSFEELIESEDKKTILAFSRGAFFAGRLEYEIYYSLGRYYFIHHSFNNFLWMGNHHFELPANELERLDEILIKASDWKEKYELELDGCDGYVWSLEYYHNNVNIKSSGYMCEPEDYRVVVRELQLLMEAFCGKYADDYTEEGIEERLRL